MTDAPVPAPAIYEPGQSMLITWDENVTPTQIIDWVLAHGGTARYHAADDEGNDVGERIAVDTMKRGQPGTALLEPGGFIMVDFLNGDILRVVNPIAPELFEQHPLSGPLPDVPGYEGAVGPGPDEYGRSHVYARDVASGAGNCVCGRELAHPLHTEAAPGVPIPAAPARLTREILDGLQPESLTAMVYTALGVASSYLHYGPGINEPFDSESATVLGDWMIEQFGRFTGTHES